MLAGGAGRGRAAAGRGKARGGREASGKQSGGREGGEKEGSRLVLRCQSIIVGMVAGGCVCRPAMGVWVVLSYVQLASDAS